MEPLKRRWHGLVKRAAQRLLAHLKGPGGQPAFSGPQELAHLARIHLTRPGALGSRLGPAGRMRFEKDIEELAERLGDLNSARDLGAFAEEACLLTTSLLPASVRAEMETADPKSLRKKEVTERLMIEAPHAHNEGDLVARGLRRTMREEHRQRLGKRSLALKPMDPLTPIFATDERGQPRLPREDLRYRMWHALSETPSATAGVDSLLDMLRVGATFAPERMRAALGDDLYAICHPEGFADQQRAVLHVRVPSAAAAQKVAMRRVEILDRLRPLPGLSDLRDIRTKVGRFSPPST